jgi:hypothetical protein
MERGPALKEELPQSFASVRKGRGKVKEACMLRRSGSKEWGKDVRALSRSSGCSSFLCCRFGLDERLKA